MADQTRKLSQLWLLTPHGGVLLAVVVGVVLMRIGVLPSLIMDRVKRIGLLTRVPIGHTFRES